MTTDADLTGATRYIETNRDTPVAGGIWYIQPDDTVVYERPTGERVPSTISADWLRSSPTWMPKPEAG